MGKIPDGKVTGEEKDQAGRKIQGNKSVGKSPDWKMTGDRKDTASRKIQGKKNVGKSRAEKSPARKRRSG